MNPRENQPVESDYPFDFLTCEAAALAGVSTRVVLRAIHAGVLPAKKFGKRTYVTRSRDVQNWVEQRRRRSRS